MPEIDLAALDTPAYVYDLAEVRRSHELLRRALPRPSGLYYSLKANPHPALLGCLRDRGCRAEVSSPGELRAALDAGFPAAEVLYTGPAKRDEDVRRAVALGVREFSADSPRSLDQLDGIAGEHGVRLRYLLRVNANEPVPGVGLAMTGVPSQFGADVDWVAGRPRAFTGRANLDLVGLHLYMATNMTDEDHLVEQFTIAIGVAARLRDRLGTSFRTLDLGGGFGAPYAHAGELPRFPTLAARVAALLDRDFPGWRGGAPEVVFESGRYLTSTCGRLVTRALEVKWSHGKRIVVFESGINHLGGMSGLRRVPVISPDLVDPNRPGVTGAAAGEDGALAVGPLCTPLDSWTRSAAVPDFRPGEVAVVPNVGAYGLSASLALFLGHPMPAEVVVDGGRVLESTRLAVRRERLAAALPQPFAMAGDLS
ncbi:type III PLP-dependent enzyme [Saccharothrix coeruleofusca]|uniref:Diaminopimelate decarboxylase n=1 Tax=Saccharothrix coeruleofusca TaxID=33919 RepID=A0A918ARQ9_9PSEU|nr:type III PLP-dependent enzyme [Saccharothrix coeruleofusca]MBP2336698.1 diaminopimelate decarboxylase [Saccharothrix coeruleofusca]GGP78665.1 diaminopimelate decarboxylase [Saccharothrix coeruleofusca]